jgi:hypothetical protein
VALCALLSALSVIDIPTPEQLSRQRVSLYCERLLAKLVLLKPMSLRWTQYAGSVAGEPAAPTDDEMRMVAEAFYEAGWAADFYETPTENFVHIRDPNIRP